MGIKDINKFIKKYAPMSIQTIPLSSLSNEKIAIDSSNFFWIMWSVSNKVVVNSTDVTCIKVTDVMIAETWLQRIYNFIYRLLMYNITPIFILDGVYPKDKIEVQKERRDDRNKIKDKLVELQQNIQSYDILDRDSNMINQLRKLMIQHTQLSYRAVSIITEILQEVGIPVITAPNEAEQLCSILCRDGYVKAVYSTDTDNLVYGCPLLITGFDKNDHITTINYGEILKCSQLTEDMFKELCIMCGCDYNNHQNIPRVGVMTSYKLIKQYTSIDQLPSKYDTSSLKYQRCRQLFEYIPCSQLCPNLILDINKDQLYHGTYNIIKCPQLEYWLGLRERKEISQNNTYIEDIMLQEDKLVDSMTQQIRKCYINRSSQNVGNEY